MTASTDRVTIFVEHVARELDVACALKHWLTSSHGQTVELAPLVDGLEETLRGPAPRVVVLPYAYSAADLGTRQILARWPDSAYVNLAYEQVLHNLNKGFKAPRDRFVQHHVLHVAWGEFYARYLREHGVAPENVWINGNPTLALYAPPYAAYYRDRAELAREHGLEPTRRWVLIPENYAAAFYTDAMLADYIRRGYKPEQAHGFREFARASLRTVIAWCRESAESSPVEMIVRPRPAIPESLFAATCRGFLNGDWPARLHVIKRGTVREWILAADVVASSWSTTLIDAAIAGKPICMLMPFAYPDFLRADWYDHVPPLRTSADFRHAIESADPLSAVPLAHWARAAMLLHTDPIRRLADCLAALAPPPGRRPLDPAWLRTPPTAFDALPWWRRWRRRAGRLVRGWSSAPPPNFDTHEQDRFDRARVDGCTERWSAILRSPQ